MLRYLITTVLISCCLAANAEEPVDFQRYIRPLLSEKCFQCHGPDSEHREAELRLDDEADAKRDRGGYRVLAAGDVRVSELYRRIVSDDEAERMPPADFGKALEPSEVSLVRRWIEEGAAWQRHWAYERPRRHATPQPAGNDWARNWIDQFILSRLEREGLAPALDADPVTLIRRVSFDLTGLPPSRELVEQFLSDATSSGFERVVEQLLSSDAYGERMAVYWLDLVRYADTVGYHGDQDHNISLYRDYVIDAFNVNLPFDRFTREQLAGDLLLDGGVDQQIATGYNRLLQTSHEGGVQPREYLTIYAADRVRNLSGVWLGGTLGCAQCHDHKYDPYTMEDFYSLAAFFADIDEAQHFTVATNALPTERPPEIRALSRRERMQAAELKQQLRAIQDQLSAGTAGGAGRGRLESDAQALEQLLRDLESRARMTMVTVAIEPRVTRLLPRGNWLDDSGPVLLPAVPKFLGRLQVGDRRATRLDLANWLTDPEHGIGLLTARVMVNRFWYLMFGSGLAASLDDFGGQSEPPIHPELLDRLALEFVDRGWDVKQILKLLVMSRTYQQASLSRPELRERDPDNRLYARQSRFRLPAEMIRDNALKVSGLLSRDLGGPSVKPYQPAGYYRHLNFPRRQYKADTGTRQWRRGLYMHWQRQFLHPMLRAFDAPRREECTAQRPQSNTPLAALTLLNDPTFVEAARAFAESILVEQQQTFEARLEHAFQQALSRGPDPKEQAILKRLWTSNRRRFAACPEDARELLQIGSKVARNDLDAVELAAWTSVTRAILNLYEFNTRL